MSLDSDAQLKWQWIQNRSSRDFERAINDQFILAGGPDFNSLEQKQTHNGETIAKVSLFVSHNDAFSSRSGLELVHNFIDQQLLLVEDSSVAEDSDQRIVEERAVMFWFGQWQLLPELQLDIGSSAEYSNVRQSGDLRQQREFFYPKPQLELNWRLSSAETWLLGINREVNQLNLADFTNSVDSDSDELRPSNPDLEQEKSWQIRIQYERILANNGGNLKAKYYYHDIEDVVDQMPVSPTESVLGNIGDGERHGIAVELDTSLAENTRGTLKLDLIDTSVTDPFNGDTRQISGVRHNVWTAEIKQEYPDLSVPLSIGLKYAYKSRYQNRRIDEINTVSESDGYLDTYVEWQLPSKMNVRLDVKNLLDNTVETDRVNFTESITAGGVESNEYFEKRLGLFAELNVSAQF